MAAALKRRQVPFVFATGYGESLITDEYRHIPRWEKPYSHRDLVRMLPTVLTT